VGKGYIKPNSVESFQLRSNKIKGQKIYPSTGDSVVSGITYATATSRSSFSPAKAQLNRYPSLSNVSKAEMPRAVVVQNLDGSHMEEGLHEYNEFHDFHSDFHNDEHTIDTHVSTPVRNQTLFTNECTEATESNHSVLTIDTRRGSFGGANKIPSQANLAKAGSKRELLPSRAESRGESRRNLMMRQGSQDFELLQDVAPDKKWSAKRDCLYERESPYNDAVEVSIDEDGCRRFLTEHRWPPGVQNMLIKNLKKVPLRIFICDDSGSNHLVCASFCVVYCALVCRFDDNERWKKVIWRRKCYQVSKTNARDELKRDESYSGH
jgi:hypothetical protein